MPARISELHRTAFVTGASTGLGRAFAQMLMREGVQVWGTARDASRLAHFLPDGANAGRVMFHPVVLDLRDGAAAEDVFHHAEKDANGFDLVINNAGYGVFGEFAAAVGFVAKVTNTYYRSKIIRGRVLRRACSRR